MSARSIRTLGLCAIAAVLLLGGAEGFLIAIAPLLVLLSQLLGGRYPGETALARLRRSVRTAARVLASVPPLCLLLVARSPRGGGLIAASLASRGPPVAPSRP